jgi:hypothetical protein
VFVVNGVAQAQRGLGLSAAALATPACCRVRRSQGASLTLPPALRLRSQHVSQELVLFSYAQRIHTGAHTATMYARYAVCLLC